MSDEETPSEEQNDGAPPRIALYAIYALLAVILLAVFIIVGVYGA